MKFKIKGEFSLEDKIQSFLKEIEAETEKLAEEKLYQLLGSHHGLQRSKIRINEIEGI